MPDEPFQVCPYCRERITPDEPGVVYACQQVDAPGFGQAHDWIDGRGGFFHADCPPEAVGYARRAIPGSTSAA
jgi:hypothetical protein